jgi:hypothetical protein
MNILATTLSQIATLEKRGNIAIQELSYGEGELRLTALLSYEEDGLTKWAETTTPIQLQQAYDNDRDLLFFLWSGEVYESP